jgi:hypothetical protein
LLQAEEEKGLVLPINHLITKEQCEGKGRITDVLCVKCVFNISQEALQCVLIWTELYAKSQSMKQYKFAQ